MSRVSANGPGDRGSIPSRVIPKTQKMVLDATLLNTQHYKVGAKCKVEQSREKSSNLSIVAIEKGAFESPSTKVANNTFLKGICPKMNEIAQLEFELTYSEEPV